MGNSFELSDKSQFTTLVRTVGPMGEVGGAMVAFFKMFNWQKTGLLYIDSRKISLATLV